MVSARAFSGGRRQSREAQPAAAGGCGRAAVLRHPAKLALWLALVTVSVFVAGMSPALRGLPVLVGMLAWCFLFRIENTQQRPVPLPHATALRVPSKARGRCSGGLGRAGEPAQPTAVDFAVVHGVAGRSPARADTSAGPTDHRGGAGSSTAAWGPGARRTRRRPHRSRYIHR